MIFSILEMDTVIKGMILLLPYFVYRKFASFLEAFLKVVQFFCKRFYNLFKIMIEILVYKFYTDCKI